MQSEQAHKKKILWLVYGFYGAFMIPSYFIAVAGILEIPGLWPLGWALGALVLVLSIAISLTYTDIFKVQVVIRRTIVYAVLGLILVFLFAVLEEALISFLGNYFEALARYNSLFMAGILAVTGSLLKKVIDPIVGKYLKF